MVFSIGRWVTKWPFDPKRLLEAIETPTLNQRGNSHDG